MAVSSLTSAPLLFAADLLSDSTNQQMPIGCYAETADGRGYRYALVGATSTVAGKVYQGKALDATNDQPSGGHAVAAAAIGATVVTTTATLTVTLNEFAEGFLAVVVTPGEGYTYKIKSHPAATAATVAITLEDPIQVALTTSSRVIWVQNTYKGVVIEPGTPTAAIAGVANSIITNAKYGWLQTWGPCSVLFTGTGAAGKAVGSLSGGTSGSSAPAIAATNILGYHMATGITTEYSMIHLTIH